jgi:hypothetical protein
MSADGHRAEWLASIAWEHVEALNERLCKEGRAQHGRSRDGYAVTMAAWNAARKRGAIPFADVLRLCRDCHRLAPFLFYNGNTFAAIVRLLSDRLPLGLAERARIRQLAGHMVAGTLPHEAEAELLVTLRQEGNTKR